MSKIRENINLCTYYLVLRLTSIDYNTEIPKLRPTWA